MELQTRIIVGTLVVAVLSWLFRTFARRQLSSGQTLFWGTLLVGALVMAAFPSLVDSLSGVWGNLMPVSWITFLGLLSLITYLLHQSTLLNRQQALLIELARQTAFIEQRLRALTAEASGD